MKDIPLIKVTKIVDDETGIWSSDLCEYSIYTEKLEDFLKAHGERGVKEINRLLDVLKERVVDYLKEVEKESENTHSKK